MRSEGFKWVELHSVCFQLLGWAVQRRKCWTIQIYGSRKYSVRGGEAERRKLNEGQRRNESKQEEELRVRHLNVTSFQGWVSLRPHSDIKFCPTSKRRNFQSGARVSPCTAPKEIRASCLSMFVHAYWWSIRATWEVYMWFSKAPGL